MQNLERQVWREGGPRATRDLIDKIRDSKNEVGGRVLEMSGADYLIRGLGYIKTLSVLENIPVGTQNSTPVLVRDLGAFARLRSDPKNLLNVLAILRRVLLQTGD